MSIRAKAHGGLAGVLETADRLLVLAREGRWEQFTGAYPAYATEVRIGAGTGSDSREREPTLAGLTQLARITRQFTDLAIAERERQRSLLARVQCGQKARRCYGRSA